MSDRQALANARTKLERFTQFDHPFTLFPDEARALLAVLDAVPSENEPPTDATTDGSGAEMPAQVGGGSLSPADAPAPDATAGSACVPDPVVPVLPVQVQAIRDALGRYRTLGAWAYGTSTQDTKLADTALVALDALVAECDRLRTERDRWKWGRDWQYDKAVRWTQRCFGAEERVQTLTEALAAYEAAVRKALRVAPTHWHHYRDPFELGPITKARSLARVLVGGEPAGPQAGSGGSGWTAGASESSGGKQR